MIRDRMSLKILSRKSIISRICSANSKRWTLKLNLELQLGVLINSINRCLTLKVKAARTNPWTKDCNSIRTLEIRCCQVCVPTKSQSIASKWRSSTRKLRLWSAVSDRRKQLRKPTKRHKRRKGAKRTKASSKESSHFRLKTSDIRRRCVTLI